MGTGTPFHVVRCTKYRVLCRSRTLPPTLYSFRGEPVQITASAVSLNVEDVAASSNFLTEHFGFRRAMAADGFASLAREDTAMYVVFLRRGLQALPDDQRDKHATGLILAFTVDDLEGGLARLRAEGVVMPMP